MCAAAKVYGPCGPTPLDLPEPPALLPDDILLSILVRLQLAMTARTSALSKRWRGLPWLLPELNLHVMDFLPAPPPRRVEPNHMDRAMASLAEATRVLLGGRRRRRRHGEEEERAIVKLSLKLYMTAAAAAATSYSHDVGLLVNDAIDRDVVKELDLSIVDETGLRDCRDKHMLQQARDVDAFFTACPSVLPRLSKLHLDNVRFAPQDMYRLLFDDRCRQLRHLSLDHCDAGECSVWQINAPGSELRVLELYFCDLHRLEILCLPKLESFSWEVWFYSDAPLRFRDGSVPSLTELCLMTTSSLRQNEFRLSEVLGSTTNIHTLSLSLEGEKLWIQQEGKQLYPAFSMLKELNIYGIYVEFDLLWIVNLLEAAPSVETCHVELYEHLCEDRREDLTFGIQRVKPSWEMPGFRSSNKWLLKELEFVGSRPGLEQHISFTSVVMDRAPNLKTVLLREDDESCEHCDAMDPQPPPVGGMFPTDKDEQETIVKRLRDRVSWSSAQIIFISCNSTVVH